MIIENLHGEKEYVTLPTAAIYTSKTSRFHQDFGTGTMLLQVWFGPRTKRAFIQTDSIWENRRTHACVGKTTCEVDIEQLLRICDGFGIPIPTGIDPSLID